MRHLLLTLACGAYAQRSEHIVHLSDEKHHSSLHASKMLALLLLVAPLVASASRADKGDVSASTGVASLRARGDAHIVHLCSESHRAAVGAEWPDAHHITNLPSLKALIVHATAAEVASLQADARVCGVHADRPVSHALRCRPLSSFGALLHSSRVMSRSLLIFFFWSSTAFLFY